MQQKRRQEDKYCNPLKQEISYTKKICTVTQLIKEILHKELNEVIEISNYMVQRNPYLAK